MIFGKVSQLGEEAGGNHPEICRSLAEQIADQLSWNFDTVGIDFFVVKRI